MVRFIVVVISGFLVVSAASQLQTNRRPIPVFKEAPASGLKLPNNATAIRENIVDTFSCEGRIYGYYADVDNECQIFHVCMPQNRGSIRWSFICPESTVFNQATFVCTWTDDSIPCAESEQYYNLNEEFGKEDPKEPENPENTQSPEEATYNPSEYPPSNELPVTPFYGNSRGRGRSNRGGKSHNLPETTETPEPIENTTK